MLSLKVQASPGGAQVQSGAHNSPRRGRLGLGGAYLCIYPMDSPGGYQLVGRTLPIWNTFGRVGPFTPAKPWLLRNFDQVQLYWLHSVSYHTSAALIGHPVKLAKPRLLRRHQCCSLFQDLVRNVTMTHDEECHRADQV